MKKKKKIIIHPRPWVLIAEASVKHCALCHGQRPALTWCHNKTWLQQLLNRLFSCPQVSPLSVGIFLSKAPIHFQLLSFLAMSPSSCKVWVSMSVLLATYGLQMLYNIQLTWTHTDGIRTYLYASLRAVGQLAQECVAFRDAVKGTIFWKGHVTHTSL